MNIHEYQSKAILKSFGVPVPNGAPAFTVEEVEHADSSSKGANPCRRQR